MNQPEPTIEQLKEVVESNLINHHFLVPVAFVCTPFGNLQIDAGEYYNNEVTKQLYIDKLLSVLEQHQAYKIVLVHETWMYSKPDFMDDLSFLDICMTEEDNDFLDKAEGYTISEISTFGVRIFLRKYNRKNTGETEEEIVFEDNGSIIEDAPVEGFKVLQNALQVLS